MDGNKDPSTGQDDMIPDLLSDLAHQNYNLRIYNLDLSDEKRQAGLDLVLSGQPVAGREVLGNAGDEHIAAFKPDLHKHPIQKLPGPSGKGAAASILHGARCLADKKYPGRFWTFTSHRLHGPLMQPARPAVPHFRCN